jgi:hypothetical protein
MFDINSASPGLAELVSAALSRNEREHVVCAQHPMAKMASS